MKIIKVTYGLEIPKNYTGIAEYPSGTKSWWFDRKLHRTDGPAIEHSNGAKFFYLEGECYSNINLKDYIVLDSYQRNHNLMRFKLLGKDEIVEYPDIPGLISK